ncbi:MAG: hypothetical protein ABS46_11655 [Cytophagaceae bacterium SCN 52-12]|nr:MAG: hypothetical protein ABS46_11655 [Cytophagaceae bacterium SCN 52-12]
MTKNRWSYGISGGAAAFRQMRNDKRTNYIFYEVRPEIKFYWFQGNDIGWKLPQDMGCYFAMEGIYANSRYTIENSSFYADFEQITSFEKADFRKSKFGGVAKSGVKFLIGRKLSVDFYSGIGFARTDVAYSDVVNPQNKSEDTGFKAEDFYDGKKTIPQFVLGLKVGIRLWEE